MSSELAKVVKVIDEYKIVINKGANDGVMLGSVYLVYKIGEELFDPDTQESLGQLEIVRGKGKVIYVQERMCTIESSETERRRKRRSSSYQLALSGFIDNYEEIDKPFDKPQIGDIAKLIKAP